MAITLTSSPAFILHKLITSQSEPIFTDLLKDKDFPLFVGHMPEDEKAGLPVNAGCVYDTAGVKDGRDMKTGQHLFHEGIQIKVRSGNYIDGFSRLKSLVAFLETVVNEIIIIDSNIFTILNISQTSSIVSLGRDDVRRNDMFTVNFLITLK